MGLWRTLWRKMIHLLALKGGQRGAQRTSSPIGSRGVPRGVLRGHPFQLVSSPPPCQSVIYHSGDTYPWNCKYKYKYKYRWSPEWDACLRFNVLLIGRCSQTFTQVADYSIWRGMQMQKLILSVESVVQSWTTFLLQCNVEQTRVERMLKRLTWVLNLLFCFYLHLHLYLYLYLYLD